jgi:hypothetical protein
MTRHQRGFTFVHPPGLSLACGSRMAREPLGFFPRLRTPQLPATHAREGTDHRARAWDHVIGIADLLTIHLQHATSCRTAEFIPFLDYGACCTIVVDVDLVRVVGAARALAVSEGELSGCPVGLEEVEGDGGEVQFAVCAVQSAA